MELGFHFGTSHTTTLQKQQLRTVFVYFLVILVPTLFSPINVYAGQPQQSIPLHNTIEHINISSQWQYLIADQTTKAEVLAENISQANFLPVSPRPEVFNEFERAYWFRTKLVNNSKHSQELTLELKHLHLTSVSLFVLENNKIISTQFDGLHNDFSAKVIPTGNPVFRLNLSPGQSQTLYLHAATLDTMQWGASLWGQDHYVRYLVKKQLILGSLLGVILVMAAYSLVVGWVSKQRSYTYLAMSLVSLFFLQLVMQNLGSVYFWPSFASSTRILAIPSLFLFATTFLAFSHEMLEIHGQDRATSILRRMKFGIYVYALVLTPLAITVLPLQIAVITTLTTLVPILITMVYAIVKAWQKQTYAQIYLAACSPLLVSIALLGANRIVGWGWSTGDAQLVILATSAILSLALSTGLALHIRKLTKDQQTSEQNALIAKLKAKEADLQIAAAQQESEAKSSFLATMSHEIRTPMNGILGMAELLRDTPLNPQQKDYVLTLSRSGDTLMGILNDILDYSKFETGKLDLELTAAKTEQIFDDLSALFTEPVKQKNLNLYTNIAPDVPAKLYLDVTRVKQILSNLINNAIKFTNTGDIDVVAYCQGDQLVIEVHDQGIGIDAELVPHLFERFKQADSSISRRFGGTGLGLAISKLLSNLMGGDIKVTSTVGAGSCFQVTLPVHQHPLPEEPIGQLQPLAYLGANTKLANCLASFSERYNTKFSHIHNPDQQPQNTMLVTESAMARSCDGHQVLHLGTDLQLPLLYRELCHKLTKVQKGDAEDIQIEPDQPLQGRSILVAEDNPTNRLVVGKILKKWGADVSFAVDGAEAVNMFNQDSLLFDLILMDCEMPEKDGYTATIEIRNSNNLSADIPIIALTAHALPEFRDKADQAGMSDYITKPINREVLLNSISQQLFL